MVEIDGPEQDAGPGDAKLALAVPEGRDLGALLNVS